MGGVPVRSDAPAVLVSVRFPALAPITVWKRPETSLPAAKADQPSKSLFVGRFPSLPLLQPSSSITSGQDGKTTGKYITSRGNTSRSLSLTIYR